MKRKDREITSKYDLEEVIKKCKVCRVAMVDGDEIYIVPMTFGYAYIQDRLELYFHSAKEGRKVDLLKAGTLKVGFEMDCNHELKEVKNPCSSGFRYASIIGNGKTSIITDNDEKEKALNALMKHQTGKTYEFDDKMLDSVVVFKIVADKFSGKKCI